MTEIFNPYITDYVGFLLERFLLDWPPVLLHKCNDYASFVYQFSDFLNAFKGVL